MNYSLTVEPVNRAFLLQPNYVQVTIKTVKRHQHHWHSLIKKLGTSTSMHQYKYDLNWFLHCQYACARLLKQYTTKIKDFKSATERDSNYFYDTK